MASGVDKQLGLVGKDRRKVSTPCDKLLIALGRITRSIGKFCLCHAVKLTETCLSFPYQRYQLLIPSVLFHTSIMVSMIPNHH